MPYNSKPKSQGGNRGIDEVFARKPSKEKYRVVGVDTFDGGDWVVGDFNTLKKAKKVADDKSGSMRKMHVYDKNGKHIYSAGIF